MGSARLTLSILFAADETLCQGVTRDHEATLFQNYEIHTAEFEHLTIRSGTRYQSWARTQNDIPLRTCSGDNSHW